MKKYRNLTKTDRIKIETMLNSGHKVKEIAEYLHVHECTIYRERKRGAFVKRNSDWTESVSYSCEIAQQKHEWAESACGRTIKIGFDKEYAEFLEDLIVNHKFSPKAALMEAKRQGFKTTICANTLYSYIDKGIFLKLTNKYLPVKGKRVKHNNRVTVQKRANAGVSIEHRPEEIGERTSFGHWEMDTVKGKRGVTKSCLLVLTERLTRDEIIAKMPDQTSQSVVDVLDRLERKWGDMFYKVFKSITVDNGSEFADCIGIQRSVRKEGNRTFLFYCHPYSSYERGSNENQNKLVRRHIPKGEDIDLRTEEEVAYIEDWINHYPRYLFNGQTAAERFKIELEKIA